MTVPTRPLAEVTRRAIEILARELGPADTLRFVNQFTTGLGDYTAERERLFGEETLDQILGAIKTKAAERPGESVSPKKTKGRRQRGR
ncbi:MAG TPA: hypothetical protein VJ739_17685 [Gemmataceae bacterium]|nr:hypothetical protein [Gemmataceae bacterium]